MAVEDVNFMDLAVLIKIPPDTPMERLGSIINASFFDASSIAGTLKQKGLIEFSNDYPGPNKISITQIGKNFIAEADVKVAEPFDQLDLEVLEQLSGGKRAPFELANTLNLRNKDLALRLYKLFKQNYLIYELRNGNVDLLLTESGFLKIKGPQPTAPMPVGSPEAILQARQQNPVNKQVQDNFKKLNEQVPNQDSYRATLKKNGVGILPIILVVIIVIAVIVLNYFGKL